MQDKNTGSYLTVFRYICIKNSYLNGCLLRIINTFKLLVLDRSTYNDTIIC